MHSSRPRLLRDVDASTWCSSPPLRRPFTTTDSAITNHQHPFHPHDSVGHHYYLPSKTPHAKLCVRCTLPVWTMHSIHTHRINKYVIITVPPNQQTFSNLCTEMSIMIRTTTPIHLCNLIVFPITPLPRLHNLPFTATCFHISKL